MCGAARVGTELLEEEYESCCKQVKERMQATYQTISLDGWDTNDSVPLVGVAVHRHLLGLVERRGEAHTSEMLCKVAEEQIPKIEEKYGCKIIAVVTDGASNMATMRDMITERLGLASYWCQAHCLNLVAGDFLKHAGRLKTMESILVVLKAFRSVQCLADAIHGLGIGRPPLPTVTRWCSHRNALYYYNKNWAMLAQTAAHSRPAVCPHHTSGLAIVS